MRDFKFRAFYKITNTPISEPMSFYMSMDDDGTMNIMNGVEVVQFTGVCDKNNNPIYEGDIVTFGGETKYYVVFEEGCFFLYYKTSTGEPYRWGALFRVEEHNFHWDIEVIGNIYQNKNLI